MVTLIIVLILALNGTLSSADIDMIISLSFLGLFSEIAFIYYPIIHREDWVGKMSYPTYLYKLFF